MSHDDADECTVEGLLSELDACTHFYCYVDSQADPALLVLLVRMLWSEKPVTLFLEGQPELYLSILHHIGPQDCSFVDLSREGLQAFASYRPRLKRPLRDGPVLMWEWGQGRLPTYCLAPLTQNLINISPDHPPTKGTFPFRHVRESPVLLALKILARLRPRVARVDALNWQDTLFEDLLKALPKPHQIFDSNFVFDASDLRGLVASLGALHRSTFEGWSPSPSPNEADTLEIRAGLLERWTKAKQVTSHRAWPDRNMIDDIRKHWDVHEAASTLEAKRKSANLSDSQLELDLEVRRACLADRISQSHWGERLAAESLLLAAERYCEARSGDVDAPKLCYNALTSLNATRSSQDHDAKEDVIPCLDLFSRSTAVDVLLSGDQAWVRREGGSWARLQGHRPGLRPSTSGNQAWDLRSGLQISVDGFDLLLLLWPQRKDGELKPHAQVLRWSLIEGASSPPPPVDEWRHGTEFPRSDRPLLVCPTDNPRAEFERGRMCAQRRENVEDVLISCSWKEKIFGGGMPILRFGRRVADERPGDNWVESPVPDRMHLNEHPLFEHMILTLPVSWSSNQWTRLFRSYTEKVVSMHISSGQDEIELNTSDRFASVVAFTLGMWWPPDRPDPVRFGRYSQRKWLTDWF